MSPPLGDSQRGPGVIGTTNRVVPFWILQATELVSLLALADLSLHVTHGGLLVGAGALFAALALVADGPLGVVRLCGRRLHVVLVMVASVVVGLAPIVPAIRPDLEGILVVELVAVGLLRLASLTSTVQRPRLVVPPGTVVETTATVVDASSPPTRPPTSPPTSPHGAAASPRATSSPRASASAGASAARWAGRAATAAAQASARHRPAAEAQVKRALRSAGRATGKVTTRTDPPDPPAG
jgi:hypothetical protein